MEQKLSSLYSLAIEPYKERLRLIVFKNGEEFVCRKENKKNLITFLLSQHEQLFKGRLQLKKLKETIMVEVKGETVGQINEMDFQQLLANA